MKISKYALNIWVELREYTPIEDRGFPPTQMESQN